jgi:HSP20 family protein
MNLTPFRSEVTSVGRLQDRMNRLFDSFFEGSSCMANESFVPAVDIVDTPENIVVKMELPGVEAKDVQVNVQENVLTISGEKKSEKEEKGKTWYRRETSYGKFSRSLSLPSTVDSEHVDATTDAGILTVRIPKSAAAKARQIAIQVKKP